MAVKSLVTEELIDFMLHFIINTQSDVQYAIHLAEYFCFVEEYRKVLMESDLPGVLFGLLRANDKTVQAAVLSFVNTNFCCEQIKAYLRKESNISKLSELLEEPTGCFVYYITSIIKKMLSKGPKEFGRLLCKSGVAYKLQNCIKEEKLSGPIKALIKELGAYSKLYHS